MSAQAGASYDIAGLTNNMPIGHGSAMARTPELAAQIAEVMALFAHVIESWKIGARKPEPRFYARACEVVGIPPEACVLLDDLGINLKPARAMGITTNKVGDPPRRSTTSRPHSATRCAEGARA